MSVWYYRLFHIVSVNALALCRWQVVDAPPAHLQATETDDNYEDGHFAAEGIAR